MSLAESTISHLNEVQRLASSLGGHGIAVLEHRYHALAFGSFTLIVGKRKHRLKFDWDGKEFFLNISVADCPSSDIIAKWNQMDNMRLSPQGELDPFDRIQELTLKEFGVQQRAEGEAANRAS